MQPTRFGVLGAAAIARQTVIPAMKAAAGITCAAIASRRPGVAAEVAAELGIPRAYASYEALLQDPEIDAVYIPVANGEHRDWAEQAAAHGKHILCEKPLSVSLTDAEAMFAAAHQHGVRLMEAYAYWFHPQHDRVQRLLWEGVVGAPMQVRARLSFPLLSYQTGERTDIRLDPEAGGAGVLLDHGCYCIHTARRIFGADPISVTAHSLCTHNGVDIAAAGVLEYPGGRTMVFDVHFGVAPALDYEVLGDRGAILVPQAYGRWPAGTEFPLQIVSAAVGERTERLSYTEPAIVMLEHFGELVRNPELPAFITPEESLSVMRTLDACAESARTGRRVTLN